MAQERFQRERFPGCQVASAVTGVFPLKARVAQEFGERTILKLIVGRGQVRAQTASQAEAVNRMAGATGQGAVAQAFVPGEQPAAKFDFARRCEFGVALVRRLDVRATDIDIIQDVIDLLLREISPIRHALLLELGEQLERGRVAGLDHAR